MKDYYSILGVHRNATFYDITKAYRELTAQFGPEATIGDEFNSGRHNEIQEAYEVLSNDLKRREYDSNLVTVKQPVVKETIPIKKEPGKSKNDLVPPKNDLVPPKKEAIENTPVISTSPPTIELFKSNKLEFDNEEEVIFRWKTTNADKVTINPFGSVSPNEQKSYRIRDYKSKYVTVELIAENTSTGKKAVSSITLKNNFYDELFNFFKSEIEKQTRYTTPIQTQAATSNNNIRVPEKPVKSPPKTDYQPTIPEYQPRTTAKISSPPKEKESKNIFQIILKVFLYLFFLVSLIALIYLGFFMN